jgi:hypothetical protein
MATASISIMKSGPAKRGDADRVNQEHPLMRVYIIGTDGITLWRKAPARVNDGEITGLIERIEVRVDQIDIRLRPPRLGALLDGAATPSQGMTDDETEILSVPVRLRRAGDQNGDRRQRSVCRRET